MKKKRINTSEGVENAYSCAEAECEPMPANPRILHTNKVRTQKIGLSYAEKLYDKRWKNLRDEVVTRDQNRCKYCGSTERLQVHHGAYLRGKEPWEYDQSMLHTYCEDCHKLAGELTARFMKWYGSQDLRTLIKIASKIF